MPLDRAGVTPPGILLERALGLIPKILTLQDRNLHSPTYGCFDRNHWHYKILDFPSGMSQELVLPLALSWATEAPANPFFGQEALREWVRAGIAFASRSSHGDGSCDDYFPFEKAAGAGAFSLYAMARALEFAELDHRPYADFLSRRARWLFRRRESGRLSNHEALIANALIRIGRLLEDPAFETMAEQRIERLLGWQSSEGWFFEYQGCDPGYLTLTIAMMAEIDEMRPDLGLREPIRRAVHFLWLLQPPGGWFGGEWTSRNSHNYFPHGFEICGRWLPEALMVNSRAVESLAAGPDYSDDHILGHHCWSYLLTARLWRGDRPAAAEPDEARRLFAEAGILVDRRGRHTLICALKKGGSFQLYDGDRLLTADTGVSLQVASGKGARTAVCHLWAEDLETRIEDDAVTVAGPMAWSKTTQMTPWKMIALRAFMLSLGRFDPDLVRRLLQRLLITGRRTAPFRFSRRLAWTDDGLTVEDTIEGGALERVLGGTIGTSQTSIYSVTSRVYHPSQLLPWHDLADSLRDARDGRLVIRREF